MGFFALRTYIAITSPYLRDRGVTVSLAIFSRNRDIKKNCMKYKKILKKGGSKDSDRASTSEKSDQAGIVKEVDENPCDVLTAKSGKGNYSDAWLLDSGCTHTTCAQKGSSSILTSLMMEALSRLVRTPCARRLALATSIWGCLMDMFEASWTYFMFQT